MAISTSMKVVRMDKFGGPEVLHEQMVEIPMPDADELLIKNHAAGVNPVDYKIRSGKYPAVKGDRLPYTPGRDVSGTVVQCGPLVTRFADGDDVIAMPAINRGSYAQYVLVKEREATHRPASLDAIAGGAVPLAALTAWQGLFKHGGLKKGQRVLIHGGSGGVGHFAVQFAKAKGAFVATTVSAKHAEFVSGLGADQVIDYNAQRFEDEVDSVDVVLDLVAGDTLDRSWGVLKSGGILVSALALPSQEKADAHGVRGVRFTASESAADLSEIAQLIESGMVKPIITRTFALEEAAQAQRYLEEEHPVGKVVLTID